MFNANPALHPLYLAIGVLSGRALFHNLLKYIHTPRVLKRWDSKWVISSLKNMSTWEYVLTVMTMHGC